MKREDLKLCFVDYEFNQVKEEILNLVCATFQCEGQDVQEYWLHKSDKTKQELKEEILRLHEQGYIFVAYQVVAEARSFYSLGLDPYQFEWIDLFLEYRCLTNHNDELMYGKQLVDGKVKMTRRPPPKWERTEQDNKMSFRPKHNLAEATYKLTGEIRDTAHKDEMRDLIISAPKGFTLTQKNAIQAYCTEDVVFLPQIMDKVFFHYKKLLGSEYRESELIEEMLYRGKYAALTAVREAKGYPIDYEKTKALARQIPLLLEECQRDINSQFPGTFYYKKNERRFAWNQKGTKEWLRENVDVKSWTKTNKKDLSLSKDAFEKHFPFRHSYPRNNFGAQILRYLKLKQSLNGFKTRSEKEKAAGKKDFWDYVGSDKIVRPYMNVYGSATSRTQPSATGFIPLKPAWTRSLIMPPKGWAIAGLDYGSEEFLISGIESKDMGMINAYKSGDVYLAFGKDAKIIPPEGTKKSHTMERQACKSTVLGLSYDMTKYGLARKLEADTGEKWTPDEAQDYIDLFEESYSTLYEFKDDVQYTYEVDGYLQLADGWYLWGDNDNFRSVGNFPIQGMGGVIMRKADMLCYEAGLWVPFTLHDALYIMFPSDQFWQIDKAVECMREGFVHYFEDDMKEHASAIRIDAEVWSPDYDDGKEITTPGGMRIKLENIHIDERSVDEYNAFSKYFEDKDLSDDLF